MLGMLISHFRLHHPATIEQRLHCLDCEFNLDRASVLSTSQIWLGFGGSKTGQIPQGQNLSVHASTGFVHENDRGNRSFLAVLV